MRLVVGVRGGTVLGEVAVDDRGHVPVDVQHHTRLDAVAYGPGEVRPGREFYDYVAKYQSDDSVTEAAADIDAELAESIRSAAVEQTAKSNLFLSVGEKSRSFKKMSGLCGMVNRRY